MIIDEIRSLISHALNKTVKENKWKVAKDFSVSIERPRNEKFGDWASNFALVLAPKIKAPAKDIANKVKDNLSDQPFINKVEVAGPGFLNLFLETDWYRHLIPLVIKAGNSYGKSAVNKGEINLEFVSANPVGPLHIGHGRWAAVGDALANILKATGYKVTREFYINDYGLQMKLFSESVKAAMQQMQGEKVVFPEDGYRGIYIDNLAEKIINKLGPGVINKLEEIQKEAYNLQLNQIKDTLKNFGLTFDNWVSERHLHDSNTVKKTISALYKKKMTYKKENATWLKTSDFGDDKDRVIIRANGEATYFASDIAYHKDKIDRGFDRLINIWGADHHGYVARVKAAIKALGYNPDILEVLLGQLVRLVKSGKPVKMSKRAGEYVILDDLINEVGVDAIRYTFLTQSIDSNMDFDLDLVKEKSVKNPVFYVQYAYARICNVFKHAEEYNLALNKKEIKLERLTAPSEIKLLKEIGKFEEIILKASENCSPHLLTAYAAELATAFHLFYTKCRVITEDKELSNTRLGLVEITRITLKNLLGLLGVSSPKKM